MPKFGDVILAQVQFVDMSAIKTRPAVVLFEEYGNVVVAGITSNTDMQGIVLTRQEGAIKESVIKLNYIFTISENMIQKMFFSLSSEKKKLIVLELMKRMSV